MCGILGINEKNEASISRGLKSFNYRGPDFSGIYSDEDVTLGHNRLKIIDLSDESNQPMSDETKGVFVIFNGEIYNFDFLRKKLSEKYSFKTNSDTEVLVYMYKEYGIDMAKYIQGMYAIAVYDKDLGKIFLIRDHLGIKPLYYFNKDGLFIFSSEIKGVLSILKDKKIKYEINNYSVDLYFVFGYIPSPHTLYKDIFKLEKSSYIEFTISSSQIVSNTLYKNNFDNVDDVKSFKKIIKKSVLDHLNSDVPVGVFFSGGTDSSLITSILKKNDINLETFSLSMENKKEDKLYYNNIIKYLGLKSRIFDFSMKEFDKVYQGIMDKIDEPFCDNSIFPTTYLSEEASKYVKVILSGEGGDEFFYGYPRSVFLQKVNKKKDNVVNWLDLVFLKTPHFKGKNFIFESLFKFFKKPISYYLIRMSSSKDLLSIKQWKLAKSFIVNSGLSPVEFDQSLYLENVLLRKTDFATSYNSIEGRVPLLDINIVENSSKFAGVPKKNLLKPFLKDVLIDYLPNKFVYRNKSGFGMDLRAYFKDSQYLRKDLLEAIDYLNENGIFHLNIKDKICFYINKYPNFCLSLIILYRVLKNNSAQ
ncbi:asparagine synthase (glutamine-hydrolyzing) [Patescibacteria group bacterium]